jgi:nucleoside-diphosphate-sugar epimerase
VVLRNATVYGISPRLRLDLVVNDLVAQAVTSGEVVLKSDGMAWRPLVHIQDVARAFAAILEAPGEAVCGEAFNVGSTEENYLIGAVAEIVREAVPGSEVRFAEGGGADHRSYRVDCSKLPGHIPGFRLEWDVRRGAEELAEAYRRHGLAKGDIASGRYERLPRVRQLRSEGRLDESLRWKPGVLPPAGPNPERAPA